MKFSATHIDFWRICRQGDSLRVVWWGFTVVERSVLVPLCSGFLSYGSSNQFLRLSVEGRCPCKRARETALIAWRRHAVCCLHVPRVLRYAETIDSLRVLDQLCYQLCRSHCINQCLQPCLLWNRNVKPWPVHTNSRLFYRSGAGVVLRQKEGGQQQHLENSQEDHRTNLLRARSQQVCRTKQRSRGRKEPGRTESRATDGARGTARESGGF